MPPRNPISKQAIAVSGPAEQGTDFVAGMPVGPSASRELLNTLRRFPRAVGARGEAGVASSISEGSREMVDRLERKFGSFVSGFVREIRAGRPG